MSSRKKKLIVANWKMNLSPRESYRSARELHSSLQNIPRSKIINSLDIVLCPSFSALASVSSVTIPSDNLLHLGAQDCFWQTQGAFTGEESPRYLSEFGVTFIIIGHSERRNILGETNEMIQKKIEYLEKETHITPIICVGEKKDERALSIRRKVIKEQIHAVIRALRTRKVPHPIAIAYEPVWAIGTGTPCTVKDCQSMYEYIQSLLRAEFHSTNFVNQCRILYGGSVSKKNIADFVQKGVSDGALVGGASLDAHEFAQALRSVLGF